MRYAVVIKKAGNTYTVHVPDMPGCLAHGHTPEEALREAALAIALRIEVLLEEGLPVPTPSARAASVEVCWELNRLGIQPASGESLVSSA